MTYTPISPASKSVQAVALNNTGLPVFKGTPVGIDSSGNVQLIDLSVENSALAIVGIIKEDTPNGEKATIIGNGKIHNISTSVNVGSAVYISKAGDLTDQKPSIGVGGFTEGDFVIFAGMILINEQDPANKDIYVNIGIMGQL